MKENDYIEKVKILKAIKKIEKEKAFALKQSDYWHKQGNNQCTGIWQGKEFAYTEVIQMLNKITLRRCSKKLKK